MSLNRTGDLITSDCDTTKPSAEVEHFGVITRLLIDVLQRLPEVLMYHYNDSQAIQDSVQNTRSDKVITQIRFLESANDPTRYDCNCLQGTLAECCVCVCSCKYTTIFTLRPARSLLQSLSLVKFSNRPFSSKNYHIYPLISAVILFSYSCRFRNSSMVSLHLSIPIAHQFQIHEHLSSAASL